MQKIIIGSNAVAFQEVVNALLAEGWRVIPGTTCIVIGPNGVENRYSIVLDYNILPEIVL